MPSSLSAAPPAVSHAAAAPPTVDVMFAVTSAWTVCLAVTLHSLARHSSPERNYRLWVVHDGLEEACAGTEFAGVSNIYATCSWKLFHMIGSKKPWLFPEKSEEYIVSAAVWWKPAMETASLRPHLSQLLEEFTQWTRRQLRHNQWHLPFSFGNGFRKRKARINLLKRLLRVFEGV